MNKVETINVVDYFLEADEVLHRLWYKLQRLFPKLALTEFEQYKPEARLLQNEYRTTVFFYEQLELAEDVERFGNLMIDKIVDKIRRHPKIYRPLAESISFDKLMDRIIRIKIMLITCKFYTKDIDLFDESGIAIRVLGGLKEMNYYLDDLVVLIDGLQSSGPDPVPSTDEQKDELSQPGFESYLLEPYREKLPPYLINKYRDKKPRDIVPMLYALELIRAILGKVSDYDQTALHKALTITFGFIGVRTSLNDALLKYDIDPKNPNLDRKQKIEVHRQAIEAFLMNDK